MPLFRWLLRLLPRDFRAEYGQEMCRVVAEQWRVARPAAGPLGAARFWTRQALALVRAAWSSRRGALSAPLTIPRHPSLPSTRQRRQDGRSAMDGWLQDVRYSIRSMLKRPGFTVVAVATLALGIGASSAIFSAVHAVLLRGLPYADADRIVTVFHASTVTGQRGGGLSAINARDLMENAQHLGPVAIADPYSLDLLVEGRAESLRAWLVSEGFFEAAGAEPMIGRSFTPDEYAPGAEAVALLGHASWQSRFGGDPGVVGSTMTLDGGPVTVVGVLPPDFRLPDEKELWLPRPPQRWDENGRAADYMLGIGRLAPGSSVADAQAEVTRLAAGLEEAFPQTMGETTFEVVPLREYLFGDVRTPLLVLLGAVGFVLLIACANVAGLMLARGTSRTREFALRSAIGASAGRLVRQITVDSLLLAALGCVTGIGIAWVGVQAIRGLGPDVLPRIGEMGIDRTVLGFAAVVSAVSAVLAGLAPSLRFSRPDLAHSLQEGARGATEGPRGRALRGTIVVGEIALAMVLLVGAGLLAGSFTALMDRDLGFDPGNRLAVQVFAYGYGQDGGLTRTEFASRTIEEMEALPGVRRVAIASNVPAATDGTLASIDIDLPFTIVDRPAPPPGSEPEAQVTLVSESYFEVLAIPLASGRPFARSDDAQAPPVIVVNEAFVRRHFPGESPLGQKIAMAPASSPIDLEIVGVVRDVLPKGHESEPVPEVYASYRQWGSLGLAGNLTFVLHTGVDAASLAEAARQAIWRVNPAQSIWGATTLESLLGDWLRQRRFNLLMLGSFAGLALLLAGIGIYGLISFSVEQRVGEMGIRRALGGRAGSIVGLVLREALSLAGAGVLLGAAGALMLSRLIAGMLYGVEPTDPATFVGLALAVLVVAVVAAAVPAVRALRIDPVVALRAE